MVKEWCFSLNQKPFKNIGSRSVVSSGYRFVSKTQKNVNRCSFTLCLLCVCCIFDCVSASSQPVRSYQSAVLAAVAWLSLAQGPRGFRTALFSLSGDMCCDRASALWTTWGMACCGCGGVNRPGLRGYVIADAPRGGRSTLKADKGISMCFIRLKRSRNGHVLSHYTTERDSKGFFVN